MLRVALAALAALVVVPIEAIRQPPEAPPCERSDPTCITPTLFIEVADHLAYNAPTPPAFPWMGQDSPPAPTAVVLISCRTDDLTGQPGRHPPELAARDWRDLEPHIVNGELECKRVVVDLHDKALFQDETGEMRPLNANFGKADQCARAGVMYASTYEDRPGWGVLAVGCPTPITDQTGRIVGWKMPDCPNKIAGMEGIKCKFDESMI